MKTLTARIGNLEVRTVGSHLLLSEEHATMEIVLWETASCFVLAYWEIEPTLDGGRKSYLRFVGNRPFTNNINVSDFWKLACMGQEHLEASYG